MSCGFLADRRAQRARRRLAVRAAPALRRGARAARAPAGALKYAEDLLDERFLMLNGDVLTDLDLHGADRRSTRRTGAVAHARARARRGPDAPTASCACDDDHAVDGVRREAERRPDRHEPHHRRRLRARAPRARPDPGRPQRLDRARGVARSSSATGSTASRPTALLARHRDARALPAGRPSTSSRATCAPRWPSASATATWPSASASRRTGGSSRRRSSIAAARSPPARTSARSSCSARASAWASGAHDRALGRPQRRRDRRRLRAARLHRRRRRAGRRGLGRSRAGPCSARA